LRIKHSKLISKLNIGKKHPERTSETFTSEWREKISCAAKGRIAWNKGKLRTEEEKKNIRVGIQKKGGRAGKNNSRYGTSGKFKWMKNLSLNLNQLVLIDEINDFKNKGYILGKLPMTDEQKKKLSKHIKPASIIEKILKVKRNYVGLVI
jgi:hypothetical protein